MLKSMTGYGKSNFENEEKKVTIEVKSLNSKQLDVNIKLPPLYREKEIGLRNIISKRVSRGKIEVVINADTKSVKNTPLINDEIVKSYYTQIMKLREEADLIDSSDLLSVIMRLPDTLKIEKEELNDNEWNGIEYALNKAIDEFENFRNQEGANLEKDIIKRIGNILNSLNSIDSFEKERINNIKGRIQKNSIEFLNGIEIDKNRFEQELLFYIEKIDITEEKVRLQNHCSYFLETIKDENPGKKLGFISQEIGREINTIGSKANDMNIQKIVVEMKDELEKVKEQLMNVL